MYLMFFPSPKLNMIAIRQSRKENYVEKSKLHLIGGLTEGKTSGKL